MTAPCAGFGWVYGADRIFRCVGCGHVHAVRDMQDAQAAQAAHAKGGAS